MTVAGAEQKDAFLHSKPAIQSRKGACGDQTDLRWTPGRTNWRTLLASVKVGRYSSAGRFWGFSEVMGGSPEHEFRSLVNPHLFSPSALVMQGRGYYFV